MKIVYVRPENVWSAWPMFRDYANRVIEITNKRRCPAKFLLDLSENKESLLFITADDGTIKGFCTTSVCDYDRVKILQARMLAGDGMDEWLSLIEGKLEEIAKDNQCSGVELIGRKGWIRKLAPYGWKESSVILEKRFD